MSDSTVGCYLATPARSTWLRSLTLGARAGGEEKKEATRETPCARVCVRNVRRPRCETACRVRLSIGRGYSGVPKIRSAIAIFFSHNRPNLIPQRGDLGESGGERFPIVAREGKLLGSRMLRFARGDNLRRRRIRFRNTLRNETCVCAAVRAIPSRLPCETAGPAN